MPQTDHGLADHVAQDVDAVLVAVGSRKHHHPKFHRGRLIETRDMMNVRVPFTVYRVPCTVYWYTVRGSRYTHLRSSPPQRGTPRRPGWRAVSCTSARPRAWHPRHCGASAPLPDTSRPGRPTTP